MKTLDVLAAVVYKTGLVSVASIAAAALLGAGSAHADYVLGVPIPKKAVPEGANRYLVPGSLKDAVKFFKKKFKKAPHVFLNAVDQPGAKVVHVRSGDSGTGWEGINIAFYDRKVHLYVIPRGGRSPREEAPRRNTEEPAETAPAAE